MSGLCGTPRIQVVVVERHLPDNSGKRHRQLAAGVDVAEQDIGDGVAPFGSRQPGFQDCGNVLGDPADGQRPAAVQNTTVGVPVAWIAWTSSSWWPGRSSELREAASPLIAEASPTATIASSASRARRTASAIPSVEPPSISHPLA